MASDLSKSSLKSSCSSLSKLSKTGFYGYKGPLGVHANFHNHLSPTAELNVAKDYNTKVNKINLQTIKNKENKNSQSFDQEVTSNLKKNIQINHDLSLNNPTFQKTDTITQLSHSPKPIKAILKMIPLSNTDNMRDLISNQSCENLTVRESMINYESIDKAWKSSVKKIDLHASQSKENFEIRQRKPVLVIQTGNPLLGQGNSPKSIKIRISSPLSSYAPNLESKKLIQYEYGQDAMKEKPVSPSKIFYPQETNKQDFGRKKESNFNMKGMIVRGKY